MPLRSLNRQRSDRSKAAASAVEVVAAALGDGYVKQDRVGSPGHYPTFADDCFRVAYSNAIPSRGCLLHRRRAAGRA